MKLCVAIPCFFKNVDFCDAIERVAGLGFDAVETYNWKTLDLPRVRKKLERTGVKLLSMCTTSFNMTDPDHRGEWLSGLEESCQAAEYLGVKKLITQVGRDTGATRETQHASIVEGFRAAIPTLERYGVTVMPEPLNVLVNHKGYYLSSAHEGFDIIKEVAHPNVRLIYDIYHQQITEGNIIPSVTENLDLIAHLHAAGTPGRHEMWLGELDYTNVFAAIDREAITGIAGLNTHRPRV
jgi:hydroxypyruvate isomerase